MLLDLTIDYSMFFASSHNASQNFVQKVYTFCTKNSTRKFALGSYLAVCLIAKVVAKIDNNRDIKFFDDNKNNKNFNELFKEQCNKKFYILKLLRKFGESGGFIKFGNIIPCFYREKSCEKEIELTHCKRYEKVSLQEKCLHHDRPRYALGFLNILNYIFLILPTPPNSLILKNEN